MTKAQLLAELDRLEIRLAGLEAVESELAATYGVLVDAIDSLPVAFALFDCEDRLIMFNENYPRFTAINADLVEIGVTFETLVRAGVERGHSIYPQGSVEAKIRARMEQHLNPSKPFERQRTDGTWLLVSERRTSGGGIILVETDITNQKLTEQEIRVLNENLERRVAERTKLLETAINDAETANRAKSEFLSRMSHELRTPLNAILGFGEVLQTISDANLSALQRQSVDHILEAGKHLLDLVNELLDLASIEAGKVGLDIQPLFADSAINECLNLVKPLALARNIEIIALLGDSGSVTVLADRLRLKQILLNIFSNAIKYSRIAGSVTLQTKQVADQRLRISVTDSGDGISEADQKLIFEPFSRSPRHQESVEGIGIGLAITKQLVEMMQGRIGFDSPPNSGAVFWIELPTGSNEAAAVSSARTNATK